MKRKVPRCSSMTADILNRNSVVSDSKLVRCETGWGGRGKTAALHPRDWAWKNAKFSASDRKATNRILHHAHDGGGTVVIFDFFFVCNFCSSLRSRPQPPFPPAVGSQATFEISLLPPFFRRHMKYPPMIAEERFLGTYMMVHTFF